MKGVLSILGFVALGAVLLPLLAVLLFAFPVEFAVATWHNLRIDASTKGTITQSEVTGRRDSGSNAGSAVTYSFTHDNASYSSSRWRAGLFSNSSRESGGGEFAQNHPAGSEVVVFYDSSDPGFSLLQRGWPKWSLGFSMAVWGMGLSCCFGRGNRKTRRLLVAYPVSRALTIAGFLTIVLSPPTLSPAAIGAVMAGFVILVLIALLWLLLGRPAQNNEGANNPMERTG